MFSHLQDPWIEVVSKLFDLMVIVAVSSVVADEVFWNSRIWPIFSSDLRCI